MEELLTLKKFLLEGNISQSLAIVEELEEMSRDDKINNIISYSIILLIHLIKQQVENRTTRSWDISIRNSVRQIQRKNKRRKAGGSYLNSEELIDALNSAYPDAIDQASLEVEEGRYTSEELAQRIDQNQMIDQALTLILASD